MLLEIGERVPSPFCDIAIRDGALFKFDEDGSAYLPIYFFGMSNEETQKIRTGKIRTAYLAEPPFWLGFIRIGSIICELEVDEKALWQRAEQSGFFGSGSKLS